MHPRLFSAILALGLLLALIPASPEAYAQEPRIAVLGDAHGEVERLRKLASELHARGITHVILTGDLVGFDPEDPLYKMTRDRTLSKDALSEAKELMRNQARRQLEGILQAFRDAGFSKEQLILKAGNWENAWVPEWHEIFKKYGTPVTEKFDGQGVVTVGGKRGVVSHYPKIPVPSRFLRDQDYGDAFFMNGQSSLGYPSEKVDFFAFGHSHNPLVYQDPKAHGAWVINPGGVTGGHHASERPTYGLVDYEQGRVEIRSLNHEIVDEHLLSGARPMLPECGTQLKAGLKKL